MLSRRDRAWRRRGVHVLRLALLCAIVLLIHWRHRQTSGGLTSVASIDVRAETLRTVFPEAAGLGALAAEGEWEVIDAGGKRLGTVMQTSPAGDRIIGFSGPTNVLIAFDAEERIAGLSVLSSGDTREHVRAVVEEGRFLETFDGMTRGVAAGVREVDVVSGATLTSLAMAESVMKRLGGARRSLKFPDPAGEETIRELFAEADESVLDERFGSLLHVYDVEGVELGTILRTSPAADNVIGYLGPTEAFIAVGRDGRITGVAIGESYDNETLTDDPDQPERVELPYVRYVREDAYFLTFFNGRTLDELAELNLEEAGVEGVSGATMTSMAVAEGLVLAAQTHRRELSQTPLMRAAVNWDVGTFGVVLLGVVIGLTALRGRRWVRLPFQVLLIVYLGFVNGEVLSQAQLVGWAQSGAPWRNATGLVFLTAAALLIPIATKKNVYCHQLCPHGSLQQLVCRRIPWQVSLPRRLRRGLSLFPGLLLVWVLIVTLGGLSLSLVDVEPFDAYVFRIAGVATIGVAVVGLVASLFVPMAYCRFGCPTGAVLEYVRFTGRSDQWGRRDWLAVGCLAVGVVWCWVG
ncbi:MAG: hypothetical protein CMJ48_00950 [Planctomycetaceae bacterium]|nr:hypothetical protein [Planctomycetaceae bacterium]